MASNYEVNIKLNTRTVNKQLNNLEKRISKLNKLAQGGRANKTVLRNEQEKIKKAGQRLGIENKILKRKQDQLKVDRQQLKVEQQTAAAINKQTKAAAGPRISRGVSGSPMGPSSPLNFTNQGTLLPGRGFTGGRGDGVLTGALISGAFPLLFGQGPLAAAGGFGGGLIGGKFGGQMGGFAGGLIGTSVITGIQNFVSSVGELGKSIGTLDGQFNLLTEKSLFSTKEAENRARVLQALGEREKLATLVSKELTNVLGVDGAEKLKEAGEASKELDKTLAELTINLQLLLAGPITKFLKIVNDTLDPGTKVSLGKGKGDVVFGGKEEAFLNDFKEVLKLFSQGQLDRIFKAAADLQINPSDIKARSVLKAEGLNNLSDSELQAIRKFSLKKEIDPESEFVGGKGLNPEDSANNILEIDIKRVANANKKIKILEKEIEFSKLVTEEGLKEANIQQQVKDIKEGLNEEEVKLLETQGLSVRALVDKRNAAREIVEEAQRVNTLFNTIGQTIETGLVNAIEGAIQGTKTLGEVASSVFSQISRTLLQFGVNSLLSSIPGIGGLFKAEGGPVKGGKSYIVGERGPEMFTPGSSGMITPNHALGGSTNVVVNVDASGSNVEGDEQGGRELGRLISVAIQSELIEQKRPGGLLA